MDVPFNIEDDKMYSITVEPSPYVVELERRVKRLEEREQRVERMYKALVENGLMKEGEEELGGDVEDRERECEDGGGRNEFGVIVGAELLMDVDEIDWNGRETPPPFLERETDFVSEAETDFVPSHPPNLKEGLSDALSVALTSKNEGDRVSKAPRKRKAELVKTGGLAERSKKPAADKNKRVKCLTCGEEFSRTGLSRHHQKTGHGKSCPASSKIYYTEFSWQKHLSKCSHDHSGCDDQGASSSGSADANLEMVATTKANKSLKKKKSRPSPKPKSSKKLLTSKWICIECDKSFANEKSLSRHCRKQEPRHGMYCPVVRRRFLTKMSWQKHTSSCHGQHQRADVPGLPRPSLSGSARLEEKADHQDEYSREQSCAACLDGGDLLWCSGDGCNVLYHLGCMDPPLKEVPEGDWFCTGCEALRQAQLRGNSSPEQLSEEQAEFTEGNSVEEAPPEVPVDVVALAVSTMKAKSGNQQNEGTIASRKNLRSRQKKVPKPVETLDSPVEQDGGVNQASSSSQNDNGSDKGLMRLELESVIGDGNNLGGGANPDSIPALKLRVLGKMLAELENMQGNNSNAK